MLRAIISGHELSRNRAIVLVALSAMLWSTSGMIIKMTDLTPLTIAGMRSAIAAVVMLTLINKRVRFTWSYAQIAGAIAYAATMILFVVATKMTTAANAILLQYTMPVFTALLGAWLLKEKVSRFDWGIIGIVLGGMTLFFLDKLTPGGLWGNIMAAISAVTFAYMIICMRLQKSGSPIETIILGNIITALFCLPFIIQDPPAGADWWPILYLGVIQLGLPFTIYSMAIKYVTALDAVLIQTVEPLLNPIWVFLAVGEVPGSWAIAGGAIVITAVTLRNIYTSRKSP